MTPFDFHGSKPVEYYLHMIGHIPILNTLEKLDGAINVLIPKWTLELYVPLGGRKGLSQWELLIMQLYPWLSIRELSINETAVSSS